MKIGKFSRESGRLGSYGVHPWLWMSINIYSVQSVPLILLQQLFLFKQKKKIFAIIIQNCCPTCSVLIIGILCSTINETKITAACKTLFSKVNSFKNFRTEIFYILYLALSLYFFTHVLSSTKVTPLLANEKSLLQSMQNTQFNELLFFIKRSHFFTVVITIFLNNSRLFRNSKFNFAVFHFNFHN